MVFAIKTGSLTTAPLNTLNVLKSFKLLMEKVKFEKQYFQTKILSFRESN